MTQSSPREFKKIAACDYASIFFNNSSEIILNVDSKVESLPISDDIELPMTINYSEYENSYVCSPYTALIPYCIEELEKLDNKYFKYLLNKLIPLFDSILKSAKINQVVHVNNWLLSTNLYPRRHEIPSIPELTDSLISKYSDHAIIFRSLNEVTNQKLIHKFKDSDYILASTRQVYIFDKALSDYSERHNYKIDKKLLETTAYQKVTESEIIPSDYTRIIELYNMLYINKYSQHNPKFTIKYLERIIEHPNFELEGFRGGDGVLDAVGGRFTIDGVTTLPIVGYDTTKSQKLGLYRLVLISSILYAEEYDYIFNASSGASGYKTLRGAQPYIEYSAIYIKHLPLRTRIVWRLLNLILDYVFVPIMKKYKL